MRRVAAVDGKEVIRADGGERIREGRRPVGKRAGGDSCIAVAGVLQQYGFAGSRVTASDGGREGDRSTGIGWVWTEIGQSRRRDDLTERHRIAAEFMEVGNGQLVGGDPVSVPNGVAVIAEELD